MGWYSLKCFDTFVLQRHTVFGVLLFMSVLVRVQTFDLFMSRMQHTIFSKHSNPDLYITSTTSNTTTTTTEKSTSKSPDQSGRTNLKMKNEKGPNLLHITYTFFSFTCLNDLDKTSDLIEISSFQISSVARCLQKARQKSCVVVLVEMMGWKWKWKWDERGGASF